MRPTSDEETVTCVGFSVQMQTLVTFHPSSGLNYQPHAAFSILDSNFDVQSIGQALAWRTGEVECWLDRHTSTRWSMKKPFVEYISYSTRNPMLLHLIQERTLSSCMRASSELQSPFHYNHPPPPPPQRDRLRLRVPTLFMAPPRACSGHSRRCSITGDNRAGSYRSELSYVSSATAPGLEGRAQARSTGASTELYHRAVEGGG